MKNRKTGVWRGIAGLLASLFAFSLCLTSIANANASSINVFLGTSSYVVEKTGESTSDGIYFESEFQSVADLVVAKQALAEEISQEGSVLFKNNGALPLDMGSEKVTIWGLNALAPTFGGLIGSTTSVNYEIGQRTVTLIDAMKERGFQVNDTMTEFYQSEAAAAFTRKAAFFGQEVPGHSLIPVFWPMYENANSYVIGEPPANLYTQAALDSAKDTAAIVFLSRDSSEASDYSLDMKDPNGDSYERPLALSDYERQMIELAKANSNGKVIVVINSDMTMEIEELKQDSGISAILWAGLPGAYGFLGVADVLSGAVNPSGHISDTYAVSSISAPAMANFGVYTYTNSSVSGAGDLTENDKGDWYVVETEGIYVGYKYYETRYEDQILNQGSANSPVGSTNGSGWNYADEISYPFGYGMSYTTFEQELQNVDLKVGGASAATVKVTNTGSVAGKDVVQLYVQAPYTAGGVEKAAIQLMNFGKTKVLNPGESETLTIEFDAQYMASYDENAVKANGTQGAWVLDAGDYYFAIGNGAHAALNNVLANKLGSTDGLIDITGDEVIKAENAVKITLNSTDMETYSVNVENALQDGDINYYIPGAVEYVTRADWTKGWETVTGLTANAEMLVGLTNKSTALTENGGGVTWGASNGLQIADMVAVDEEGNFRGALPLEDPNWDKLIEQITLDEAIHFMEQSADDFEVINSIGLDNVYLNDGPVGFVQDQVSGYAAKWKTSDSDQPTYIGPDHEYAAWAMPTMPTEPVVAATFNQELVEREGQLIGEDSLWSNITGIMAPGLNLHRAAYNSRNHEYYSEDAMLTNLMGVAFSKGGLSKGMTVEPKHFAMNHQESNRSGVSTYATEQASREIELRGFQGALAGNYSRGVMTAFNRIGTIYSGGHRGLLTQILRNEWGYTGFIVTDMINGADYMNWRDIVLAGGGTCLATTAYESADIGSPASASNKSLIQKDTKFQQELQLSLKYYLYSFAGSNAMNGVTSDSRIVRAYPWWEITLYVVNGVTGVLTAGAAVAYVLSLRKKEQ